MWEGVAEREDEPHLVEEGALLEGIEQEVSDVGEGGGAGHRVDVVEGGGAVAGSREAASQTEVLDDVGGEASLLGVGDDACRRVGIDGGDEELHLLPVDAAERRRPRKEVGWLAVDGPEEHVGDLAEHRVVAHQVDRVQSAGVVEDHPRRPGGIVGGGAGEVRLEAVVVGEAALPAGGRHDRPAVVAATSDGVEDGLVGAIQHLVPGATDVLQRPRITRSAGPGDVADLVCEFSDPRSDVVPVLRRPVDAFGGGGAFTHLCVLVAAAGHHPVSDRVLALLGETAGGDVGGGLAAREGVAVQADDGDEAEGRAAHRCQRTDRDAAVEQPSARPRRRQSREQVVAEHHRREPVGEVAVAGLAIEIAQRGGQLLQRRLVVGIGGVQQVVGQRVDRPHPVRRRAVGGECPAPVREPVDERLQVAERRGRVPFEQRRRRDAVHRRVLGRHRHPEEQPAQRRLPGVRPLARRVRVRGPAEDLPLHRRVERPVRVGMQASMMMLAVISLMVPGGYHTLVTEETLHDERYLNIGVAIVLLVSYALSLLFMIKTHPDFFVGDQSHK